MCVYRYSTDYEYKKKLCNTNQGLKVQVPKLTELKVASTIYNSFLRYIIICKYLFKFYKIYSKFTTYLRK